MRIPIQDIARELAITIPDLITRRTGETMYHIIREKIAGTAENEVIELDFTGIKVIDTSFVDELIVKLVYDARGRSRPFFVKLAAISDIAQMNIESVFSSHALYTNVSFAVITDRMMPNNSYYLGQLTESERDIINYLNVNKSAHVNEIADFLSQPTLAVSEIVENLADMRLIRRSRRDGVTLYAPL